jgi:hypothetical protein
MSSPCCTTFSQSVEADHLECMKRLIQITIPLEWGETMELIAKKGSIEMMALVRQHGCPWTERTTLLAAEADNIKCLQYAIANECPKSRYVADHYVYKGNIEMLKYCRENGCPLSEDITMWAGLKGRLNILEYLHDDLKIPLVNNITSITALRGQFSCFIYALEKGHKILEDTFRCAMLGDNSSVFRYCLEHKLGFTDLSKVREELHFYINSIDTINLDDPFWREFAMYIENKIYVPYEFPKDPIFRGTVQLKALEINETRRLCNESLKDHIAKDIITYIVCPYL